MNFVNAHGKKLADVSMVSTKPVDIKNLLENLLIMGSSSPMKILCRDSRSRFYLLEDGGYLFDEHGCVVFVPISLPFFFIL